MGPVDARLEGLPRVGGTDAGGYFELAPDVLVAIPRAGYVQSSEGARRSLEELYRIARERGRRLAVLILVDRVVSQDADSRRVWQRGLDPELVCCLGLVGSTLLARAIGSFFIGLQRPAVPTRMLSDIDTALRWAQERLNGHDRSG